MQFPIKCQLSRQNVYCKFHHPTLTVIADATSEVVSFPADKAACVDTQACHGPEVHSIREVTVCERLLRGQQVHIVGALPVELHQIPF